MNIKSGLEGLIKTYQHHVSRALATERDYDCRYEPSCSHYTKEAIDVHGPIEGTLMGFMRTMRCHRSTAGGFDPVPGTPAAEGHTPAHEHYQYPEAAGIYGVKPHKHKHNHARWVNPAAGLPRAVSVATAAIGGTATAVGFAAIGAVLAAPFAAIAATGRTDAFNAAIARKYSPESVYGISKMENNIGTPAYEIRSALEPCSRTVATAAALAVGLPAGLALGAWHGLRAGWTMGRQMARPLGEVAGDRLLAPGLALPTVPPSAPANSKSFAALFPERQTFVVGGAALVPFHDEDLSAATYAFLSSARHSIDIEITSLRSPHVLDILEEKCKAGVAVRIINDVVGKDPKDHALHADIVKRLEDAGATVLRYPVLDAAQQLNHVKMALVDGQTAYVGSMNWGFRFEGYSGETGMFVKGDVVDDLRRTFEKDWQTSGGQAQPVPPPSRNTQVRLLETEPLNPRLARALHRDLRDDRKSIDVMMYWMTSKDVVKDLVKAHEGGTAVRVMVSDIADNKWAVEHLQKKGVPTLVCPPESFCHAKIGVFDRKTTYVGSADWSAQGLHLNHELNLAVDSPELAAWYLKKFDAPWATGQPAITNLVEETQRAFLPRAISMMCPAPLQRWGMQLAAAASMGPRLATRLRRAKAEPEGKTEGPVPGYRPAVRTLDAGAPHTIKNLDAYLTDNLGAETMKAIREGTGRIVISVGEGREAEQALEQRGWTLGDAVGKAVGYHQIRHAVTDDGEPVLVMGRVNGEDRVVHMQSLLKLAGLPDDRLLTVGKTRSFKKEYLDAFRAAGPKPDAVIVSSYIPAAEAVVDGGRHAGAPDATWRALRAQAGEKPSDLDTMSFQVVELTNGKRVWFLNQVYGDLAKDLASALEEHGVGDVTFMSTAGSLASSRRVGDLVTPAVRVHPGGSTETLDWLTPLPGVPRQGGYQRVATPNVETHEWVRQRQAEGVDVVEVELGYWLDVFKSKPDAKLRVLAVVSDVISLDDAHQDMTQWSWADAEALKPRVREVVSTVLGTPDLTVRRYERIRFSDGVSVGRASQPPLLSEVPS